MKRTLAELLQLVLWGPRRRTTANVPVHRHIRSEVPDLIRSLEERGYTPIQSEYSVGAFGNFYLDFVGRKGTFRITRDRGYLSFERQGTSAGCTELIFDRAFEDASEFTRTVLEWLDAE